MTNLQFIGVKSRLFRNSVRISRIFCHFCQFICISRCKILRLDRIILIYPGNRILSLDENTIACLSAILSTVVRCACGLLTMSGKPFLAFSPERALKRDEGLPSLKVWISVGGSLGVGGKAWISEGGSLWRKRVAHKE